MEICSVQDASQELENCLDPGPSYRNWDIHMWEEGEGPLLGPGPSAPWFLFGIRRDGGNAGKNHRLATFGMCCWRFWPSTEWTCCILNYCTNVPPPHFSCKYIVYTIVSCTFLSFKKIKHCDVQLHALILCLRDKSQPTCVPNINSAHCVAW